MRDLIEVNGKLYKEVGFKTGTEGYLATDVDGKTVKVHRIIWEMHNGKIPGGYTLDHIDGDILNNRVENLRLATASQNACNKGIYSNNTSGCKGVSWHKGNKKWMVRVQVEGKSKFLGCYDNLELAELVAREAREKHHGEFARHD